MKALLLAVILIVICIVLFLAGVISPRHSRKMQGKVDALAKKGEKKGDDHAGRLGNLTKRGLEKSRDAADASARAGRRVHEAVQDQRD